MSPAGAALCGGGRVNGVSHYESTTLSHHAVISHLTTLSPTADATRFQREIYSARVLRSTSSSSRGRLSQAVLAAHMRFSRTCGSRATKSHAPPLVAPRADLACAPARMSSTSRSSPPESGRAHTCRPPPSSHSPHLTYEATVTRVVTDAASSEAASRFAGCASVHSGARRAPIVPTHQFSQSYTLLTPAPVQQTHPPVGAPAPIAAVARGWPIATC